jgi:hypothetical protein
MSELRRLVDETENEAERALLHAGRAYRSSRETRAKTLTALGLAGSTAVLAGTASAASATAAMSSLTKLTGAKLVLALSAVGAVTAMPLGYWVVHRNTPATTPAPSTQQGIDPHAGGPATRAAATPPAPLDMRGGASTLVPVPASSQAGTMGRSRTEARVVGSSVSLTQELAALDAARSMLARGNAQGALFLLDGYGRTCPHGKLEVEAEFLRVEALARNGQTRGARHAAEAFSKRHPNSVLASRVRTYLDD